GAVVVAPTFIVCRRLLGGLGGWTHLRLETERQMRESRWKQFDFVIVGCVLGLILAGVAMIHSATCGSPCAGLLPPSSYALRQGVSAVVGFALLVGISLG